MFGTPFSPPKLSVLPAASLRCDYAEASSNLFASQTSSTIALPISSLYLFTIINQFFSAIYPVQTGTTPSYHRLAIYYPSSWRGILFSFRWHLWSDSSCVALLVEHSIATQRVAGTRKAVVYSFYFSFVTTVNGRSGRMLHVNLSSAAPLLVFLYCILERSFGKHVLSTTFGIYTSHTRTHYTLTLAIIHLHQDSL
jgi:hypothetical protein